MSQDNWQIVAAHLGILKAGGTVMFLDTTPAGRADHPHADDARPVVVLTRGQDEFPRPADARCPDVAGDACREGRRPPPWLDDPTQRLATIFYTSGTTGMPKGVECPHAGYVNLALSYADYFDLIPGHGRDLADLVAGLRRQHLRDVQRLGIGLRRGDADQGADPLRPRPRARPARSRSHGAVLSAGAAHHAHAEPGDRSSLSAVPLHRAGGRGLPERPGGAVDPRPAADHQHLRPHGGEHRYQPPEPAAGRAHHHRLAVPQRHLRHPRGRRAAPAAPRRDRRARASAACTSRAAIATCPSRPPRSSSRTRGSAASTAPGTGAGSTSETQRVHFLGRIDAQLKVRGHRVEAQAVEDILQTQFSEIEAAVLDYQNEALVAFVAAPSVCRESDLGGRAGTGRSGLPGCTTSLARQLPAPSVPTRIFLVEKFVMKPGLGQDRPQVPAEPVSSAARAPSRNGARCGGTPLPQGRRRAASSSRRDADTGMTPECEEVLAICRAVFETPLGPDDGFAEAGGHSIAHRPPGAETAGRGMGGAGPRAAQRLQHRTQGGAAGRGASSCRRAAPAVARAIACRRGAIRDEAAAEVLSVGYFTTLQVLFARLHVLPAAWWPSSVVFGLRRDRTVLRDRQPLGIHRSSASSCTWLGLALPFASLLWAMLIKLLMGGHLYKNNVTPGVYPKWSRMHLRIWCIGRLEAHGAPPARRDVSQRAAHGVRACGSSARPSAATFSAPMTPTCPARWT